MTAVMETKQNDPAQALERLAADLLPVIARKSLARAMPDHVGQSYIYETTAGWETEAMGADETVMVVRDMRALEEAFLNMAVKTVIVPAGAAMNRTVLHRVCRRHGHGKAIFYEVTDE